MFKAFLVGISLLGSLSAVAAEDGLSQCTGYDSRTQAFVTGSCNGSMFTGYDTQTGAFVTGNCTGSQFTAYDSQTQAFVYGSCY